MKLNNVNIENLITVAELKDLIKISKTAIYKAKENDRLDWTEIGGLLLIVKNEKIYKLGK